VRFVRDLEAGKPTLRMNKVNQVLWLCGKELRVVKSPKSELELSEEDERPCASFVKKVDINSSRPPFQVYP
jgi:hypothetical protein